MFENLSDRLQNVMHKIKGYGKCPCCSKRKTRAKKVVQIETGSTLYAVKLFGKLKAYAVKDMMINTGRLITV